jgi:UDP-N-acetylglucosamine 3-dehydrogenase
MIKAGVVGVGMMGQHHARIYSKLDCELVGVVDKNLELAKRIGTRYQTHYFEDYKKLMDKVNVVSIAVPTSLHKQVAIDFIRNGVHCLVEKPIAATIKEAREMVSEAHEHNVKLMVGHIERFNPAVLKLKEIIEKGELGNLILISTRRVGPFVSRIRDVGIIIDSATHDIDVARYFIGREPLKVFAKSGRIKHEKEDYAIIVLDFGNVAASIEVNWFTPHKVRSLVATGTGGIAYLDYIKQKLEVYTSEKKIVPYIEKEEPLKLEIEHFLDCVKKDKEPLVDGWEGLRVLKIALAAQMKSWAYDALRNTFKVASHT